MRDARVRLCRWVYPSWMLRREGREGAGIARWQLWEYEFYLLYWPTFLPRL